MAKKKPSIIHKKSDKLMKYLKKTRKSARYSCTAIRTKVKRRAHWLQKIKLSLKHKEYDLNKPKESRMFNSKKTKILSCKCQFNIRKIIFFKNRYNKQTASFVSKTKGDHSTKRKDSFPDQYITIKKPKRSHAHPDSVNPLTSNILNISGHQIIFLPKFETCNDYSEILTKLQMPHLNGLPNLKRNELSSCRLEFEQNIELFKKNCDLIRGFKKKKKEDCYHQIKEMQREADKIPSVDANKFFDSLKDYLQMHERKQYALAIFFMKRSKTVFVSPEFEVDYENDTHTEPLLCQEVEIILQQLGTFVESILVYTLNSPCLNCMSVLSKEAYSWHREYGISTTVGFTQFWGLSGQDFFQNITCSYTNMLDPKSVFHESTDKCKSNPFKLKSFTVNSKIFQNIRKLIKKEEKHSCRKKIEFYVSVLKTLAKISFCSRETHLQCGENTIYSFVFPQKIQNECRHSLLDDWSALVNDCAKSNVIKQITKDFNVAVVEVIYQNLKSSCGNNSPLKLCHIPLNHLDWEAY
ncbi:uncharacterized protein LOC113027221 [Astatotilapia calliptera]|uniref:uncharacterized protein LOC113027221 n=1 Tax=Astatotilapia calliptera TaxID=8154 RepID=UPI000E40F51E|nr:uncharacterized protein LOC113027221 [Astatotilapia calliptera]